ncbi:TetR/AcrR family transcriptional regulator [Nocardia bhagyanarayanae]|uniref:TetR family transcriptional regulator n=1 Tax=Nocardia bhagyanarayanae TaxID=1215925 RepID=A0A543F687_9NOCA|nr:TetR/AcrR family transcriptional regulator [Nocardia bhagyanarayanae]TQM29353.1 TetR family transcriptional regulator [Nocardia bhagyanarayanae]
MSAVKGTNKRALKAQETRRRILAAAGELFVEQGYGATNLQEIAARAGVAVQTIYFTFGNKRTLLKELVDVTIAGDDEPVATMEREWFRTAMAAATAQKHLRAHIAGTRPVLERIAPIHKVIETAAATDPEVAAMWPADQPDPRYTVQLRTATALMSKPGARQDVSPEEAADLLYGMLSTELFLLLVRTRGWTAQRWEDWVYATLLPQLCA